MLHEGNHDDPVVGGHPRHDVGPADSSPAVGMGCICDENPGRKHTDVGKYYVPEMVVFEDSRVRCDQMVSKFHRCAWRGLGLTVEVIRTAGHALLSGDIEDCASQLQWEFFITKLSEGRLTEIRVKAKNLPPQQRQEYVDWGILNQIREVVRFGIAGYTYF